MYYVFNGCYTCKEVHSMIFAIEGLNDPDKCKCGTPWQDNPRVVDIHVNAINPNAFGLTDHFEAEAKNEVNNPTAHSALQGPNWHHSVTDSPDTLPIDWTYEDVYKIHPHLVKDGGELNVRSYDGKELHDKKYNIPKQT